MPSDFYTCLVYLSRNVFKLSQNRLVTCVPVILSRCLVKTPENISLPPQSIPPSATERPQRPKHDPDGADSSSSPLSGHGDVPSSRVSPHSSPTSPSAPFVSSVCFHVPPRQRVIISLSKLNAKLADLSTTIFPMLQYLDAYVCELNKFLTEHPLLLGAFMAVKLTEPPTHDELLKVGPRFLVIIS